MANVIQKPNTFLLMFAVWIICIIMMFSIVLGQQQSESFIFIKTIQVTPDSNFPGGGFARINYVPAIDRLVVTFDNPDGYAYKEYTLDMQETGKSGVFSEKRGDTGSFMVDNFYYFVSCHQNPGQSPGWRIVQYDAVSWNALSMVDLPLNDPKEQGTDQMVAFVNGQLDFSGQYNTSGNYPPLPEGAATFHFFFSQNLDSLGKRILDDLPHICGSSMVEVDGITYFVSADAFEGDVVLMKYDRDWNYLGMKILIEEAHWSTGLAFDGFKFYLSYINTSQKTDGYFPWYLNVRLAAFDRDWNLSDDIAVTDYTPEDNMQTGRPWVMIHGNRLYVSYDLDTRDPVTHEESLKGRAIVSVYELTQNSSSIEQTERFPDKFRLEQNYPNPFNPATAIMFTMPSRQNISLKVYNIFGREVAVLINEVKEPGKFTVTFNAKDLPSGLYFYKLQTVEFVNTRKLAVLK